MTNYVEGYQKSSDWPNQWDRLARIAQKETDLRPCYTIWQRTKDSLLHFLGTKMNGNTAQWSRMGLFVGLLLAHFSFVHRGPQRSLAPLKVESPPQEAVEQGVNGLTKNDIFRAVWANSSWSQRLDLNQKNSALELSKTQAQLLDEFYVAELALQKRILEVWNAHR